MAGALHLGIVAGEPSGDMLAARVVGALRANGVNVALSGVGGPHLAAEGLDSMVPMERLTVMGLTEPLRRLPELLRIRRRLSRHFSQTRPALFLGVDSPDFNLPLSRSLRAQGITTAHLVSPSVWAWRRGRLKSIRASIDHMLCLFPFELPVYEDAGIRASFVGHPLADEIDPQVEQGMVRIELGLPAEGRVLALLPGSRVSEVGNLAPVFLRAALLLQRRAEIDHCLLPVASDACRQRLESVLPRFAELRLTLLEGQSREAMASADAVLTASGTATLEAALLQRPMVVAYKVSGITAALLSRLLQTEFIALPNILAGRQIVPELLQNDVDPATLQRALSLLLTDAKHGVAQRKACAELRGRLQQDFSNRSARLISGMAQSSGEYPVAEGGSGIA